MIITNANAFIPVTRGDLNKFLSVMVGIFEEPVSLHSSNPDVTTVGLLGDQVFVHFSLNEHKFTRVHTFFDVFDKGEKLEALTKNYNGNFERFMDSFVDEFVDLKKSELDRSKEWYERSVNENRTTISSFK